MEKVIEMFDQMTVKAHNIKEAMIVIPHKQFYMEKLVELSGNRTEVEKLEAEMKTSLEEHHTVLRENFEDTMKIFKRTQMKMIYLLQHLDDEERHMQNEKRALMPINIPGTPKMYEREGAIQAFSELNTPRMNVTEYAKSPFAKKRTKVQLQFSDFEAEVSNDDFARIPGYMKGRVCLAELQEFLDNVLIRTFNNKYRTLYQHRSTLKPSEFNLQTMFKSQASYFEGHRFITVGDIARILEKNVDRKDDRHLQMLRHLHIIKEARHNSTVCYIWLKKM